MLTLEQIDALAQRAERLGYLGVADVRDLARHGREALALAEAELGHARCVTVYEADEAMRWAQ